MPFFASPRHTAALPVTACRFADSYCISVMDGSTGEEVQPYRDSHGDMPTFKTVDEAVDYCHRNGIDFENAAEVDQWHTIEVERAKAVSDGQIQEDYAEKPLTADDIQNLVLTGREYSAGSRTTVYDFECDIRGEHDSLQYTLEYHDDGEGFTIHTEKDDIWERMSEPELERLEGILGREALYFKYHEKIAGAESLEGLKEIEYEIMEDESPYFSAVSERVWKDFSQKEREMSVPEQETSGHDVQKRDYRVGDRVYLDNKPYEITRTDDWNVEIMDRSLLNPPRRLESRENFEKLRKFFHAERIFQILCLHPCILLHYKISRNFRSFMDKEIIRTQNPFLYLHRFFCEVQIIQKRAGQ